MTTKTCTKCLIEKDIKEFRDVYRSLKCYKIGKCKSCANSERYERLKKYRKTTAGKKQDRQIMRKHKLKREYNMTIEQYNQMLEDQGGVCKICQGINKTNPLHVDHCHKTNKIRGLLCHSCNVGLGHFRDNVELLNIAISYLKI